MICFVAVMAQTDAQGLSIGLDGGLQGTQYGLQDGANGLLPGGSLSLLYTFPVKGRWSLLTGITGGVYRTAARFPDGTVFSDYQVDDESSAFQYDMKTTGYKETQRFFAAGIPLLLQYHTAGAGTQWYIDGGGKVLFPTGVSTKVSAQQLSLSGYYPDYNIVVSNLPQHGFGAIDNWKASASAASRPAAALSAATGLSFRLPRGMRLYTGLYAEYGLTALKARGDSMPLVTYSPAGISGLHANGILDMQNAGRMTSLSFGLQIRISFETTRPALKLRPKPKQLPRDTANPAISDEEADLIKQPVIFGPIQEIAIPEVERPHLDDIASIMMQHPTIRISIVGHICNSGTETEDPGVGLARAEAVARYLKSKGIPRSRMNIGATRESDPVLPNNPAANYRKRRVIIAVE
jgi:outer membrane protein OmpA-like peptidoglycan-associated protein